MAEDKTATTGNSDGMIRNQIEILENVNRKLVAELDVLPVRDRIYSDIRENSLTILHLIDRLGQHS